MKKILKKIKKMMGKYLRTDVITSIKQNDIFFGDDIDKMSNEEIVFYINNLEIDDHQDYWVGYYSALTELEIYIKKYGGIKKGDTGNNKNGPASGKKN